jgi:hypothetical protein
MRWAGLVLPAERRPAAAPGTAEYEGRQKLLAYFGQPGNNVWSLYPVGGGTGHIMATCCTADHFWIFDSQCGEASIPISQLGNWFASEYVVNYLNKYQTFGASSYVS